MSRNKYAMRRSKMNKNTPYKSNFEYGTAQNLKKRRVKFKYESKKIKYVKPATTHTYTPDFELPNGIIVETKGKFTAEDRYKHLCVRESNPELDIRFVFQRAKQPIRKGSPTTYGDWATENGFKWADKEVPKEWIKEL